MNVLLLLLLAAVPAFAHVGSPNVFFEGNAGPHPVRVVIRPPNALPGIAQIDVRIADADVTAVSVQPVFFEAGSDAAPAPTPATSVAGDARLFNAPCWLIQDGSYAVQIAVESARGGGRVAVPLQAASLQRPPMPPALGATLLACGAALFLGAVSLAAGGARESVLPSGAQVSRRDRARGRIAGVATALVVIAAIGGGAARWREMDRKFRNNELYQPVPVDAIVRSDATAHRLHLAPSAENRAWSGWDTLVADHGKLMHLFLIREPDFNAFAHLHPARRDSRSFECILPALPAGPYQLYSELTHENGTTETLTAKVVLPPPRGTAAQAGWSMSDEVWCQSPLAPAGNAAQPFALDADDSWHVGPAPAASAEMRAQVSRLMGGSTMVFHNAGELVAGRETSLRFSVHAPDGKAVSLQPYMGMLGHAVVRRADGTVFTHLHPVGTISMAAQQVFELRESPPVFGPPAPMRLPEGNEVTFPYAFPRDGDYRLMVQVRLAGRVVTGVFEVKVKPAEARRA